MLRDFPTVEQEYNPTPIINEIRSHLESWRALPNPADWGVTPATASLLDHWRHHNFKDVRPFFCQVEAVETIIWLTEVARREKRYKHLWAHLEGGNKDANPGAAAHRHEDGDRQRQDHRHGHDHRLADRQRGALTDQQLSSAAAS